MTPETLLEFGLPLFDDLAPQDLAGIPLDVVERQLAPWETIFDQDDKSHDIFFLLSGSLLAVYWTDQGREIVYSRFPIGAYFGELAALDGTGRSLAVVAKTDARVLAIGRACFLQLFNDVPQIRMRVTRNLVGRIRTLTRRNTEIVTLSVEQRVARYLLRLAAETGNLSAGAVIKAAPTHAEIAATIGANREMVSRAMSKFSKHGVIKSARQKIAILDPETLSDTFANN